MERIRVIQSIRAFRILAMVFVVLGTPIPHLSGEELAPSGAVLQTIEGKEPTHVPRREADSKAPAMDKLESRTIDLLTINFYESDIRQALLGMAMDRNISVIMAPEVTGKVTIYLNSVPLDEAVTSVAMAGGFDCRKERGAYFVYRPKDKLDAQAEQLQVRVFKLKFAKTEKVQEILSSFPGVRTVRIHDDTKTVIVEDTPENIAKIETIINAWDSSPRQVLIEANILEVELKDDMRLGVDWDKVMGSARVTTGSNFSGPAFGGVVGTVKSGVGTAHEFSAALAALESKTRVNTLSTPKILAVHGKPARVQVGGKTGYKTTVTNLGVTTEQVLFIDTGTILDITAYIGDDNNILLNVQPQISSVSLDPVSQIPNVNTTSVSTSLLTKSGQTVFIGGLIKDVLSKERQAIPVLGNIPVLGTFFGFSHPRIEKTEMIVLITPRLLEEEINHAGREAAQKVESLNEEHKKEPPSVYRELMR
jgi:type II secretory pathway component GspD/PulD (secretin)